MVLFFYGKRVRTDEVILQSLQMVEDPSKFTAFGNKEKATTLNIYILSLLTTGKPYSGQMVSTHGEYLPP
jgi:hypothetical protein